MDPKPTETLEDYLAGDYHTDMDDIRDVEDKLERVASVFIYACGEDGRWPYEARSAAPGNGGQKDSGRVSHGTQAMIAAALGKMADLAVLASGNQARLKLKCGDNLQRARRSGIRCLVKDLENKKKLISGTFGTNDPVTLSHVADLLQGMKHPADKSDCDILKASLTDAMAELRQLCEKNPARDKDLLAHLPRFQAFQEGEQAPQQNGEPKSGRKPDYVVNAFVTLRVIRAVRDLASAEHPVFENDTADRNDLNSPHYDEYRHFFESTLYAQLSFSAVPDSRFDPAELIFCLEGLMLCGRHAVDDTLFKQVLTVLQGKQEGSAHWRPNRPIYATPQGLTMLPVSVEGAISLLRSIALIDAHSDYQLFSSSAVLMARRFWQWLRARIVQFRAPNVPAPKAKAKGGDEEGIEVVERGKYRNLAGWHSEHVNDPGLIHLWDTSQVAEFMLAYRELLQRSVAGRTLLLSRLQINEQSRTPSKKWEEAWPKIVAGFEPRLNTEKGQKIYDELTKDFVKPWSEKLPKNYSMLLYGPPGTGKTVLGKNIAQTLGMRMITVTVSDFLGKGEAHVEARAKAIFQTLEAQSDTVILFDEIDSFLLDRDSKLYRDQETVFQFLTPGMLTKINDLRKKERSIFIIATNYANRIDPAIKRKGRIDRNYLLQLPNKDRRLAIIKHLTGFEIVDGYREGIERNSLFLGYSDLEAVINDTELVGASKDETDIEKNARIEKNSSLVNYSISKSYQGSAALFMSYLRRYEESEYPFEELFELLDLKIEIDREYDLEKLIEEHQEVARSDKFMESGFEDRMEKEWAAWPK